MFPIELEQALRAYFQLPKISAYDLAVGLGPEDAIGGFDSPVLQEFSPGQRIIIRQVLATDPQFAIPLIAHSNEEYRRYAREVDEAGMREIAAVRAQARADGATREDLLLHNQLSFCRGQYLPELLRNLTELGISLAGMGDWPEPRPGAPEFMMSLPTVDVWMTTTVERDFDWNRVVTGNDIRDQAFLSTAIPYCDVVVTERYWGALVRRTGLSDRHSCRVVRRLEDLVPILEENDVAGTAGPHIVV